MLSAKAYICFVSIPALTLLGSGWACQHHEYGVESVLMVSMSVSKTSQDASSKSINHQMDGCIITYMPVVSGILPISTIISTCRINASKSAQSVEHTCCQPKDSRLATPQTLIDYVLLGFDQRRTVRDYCASRGRQGLQSATNPHDAVSPLTPRQLT